MRDDQRVSYVFCRFALTQPTQPTMVASPRLETSSVPAPTPAPADLGGLRLMDSCATTVYPAQQDPAAAAAASPSSRGASSGAISLAAVLQETSFHAHNPIHDWLDSPTRDISARLALFSPPTPAEGPASPTSQHSHPPRSSVKSTSSMARTCLHQPSNASSNYPPSLLFTEATPTESSVSTGLASRFEGVPLLEEVDGVLERPRTQTRLPAFECSFWFLSCSYISYDQEEWTTHCLSHFRGEEPPRTVQCPLCSEFKCTADNGWDAWQLRLEHVAYHQLLGHTLTRTSRPEFDLFRYLWQKRLIDDQDLKELNGGNHNLTRTPANYTETGGRGRGLRDRERRARRPGQHVGRTRRAA